MFKLAQLHASSTFKIWLLGENKWNMQLERFSVDQTIVNQDYESGFKKLSSMNFLVFYAIVRDKYVSIFMFENNPFIHKGIITTVVVGR